MTWDSIGWVYKDQTIQTLFSLGLGNFNGNSQEQASSILTRWLQLLNCAALWSGGELKFIPYGDSAIAGGAQTTYQSQFYVILFKIGRCFAHGGIVSKTDPLSIVHAFLPARCVLEDEIARSAELSDKLRSAKFASYWAPSPRRNGE